LERQSDLRDWMQGVEWWVVRLITVAKPKTLGSSCGGSGVDFVFLLDDDGVGGDFVSFGSSVERTVPTEIFSRIKSDN